LNLQTSGILSPVLLGCGAMLLGDRCLMFQDHCSVSRCLEPITWGYSTIF